MTAAGRLELTHWIGGRRVAAHDGTIEVADPATGRVVTAVPAGDAGTVDAAVRAAQDAFREWSATPLAERVAAVRRISAALKERADDIATSITTEMGAPIVFSRKVQARMPVASSRTVAELAETFPWEEEIGNSLVVKEPIGVVAAITPWNYPLHQIVAKVAPAVLAGNTVVLKPSEVAPRTAAILAEAVAEAGVPAGVYNVVYGTGPVVGEALAAHPGVDMVSFTGSTRAGKRVSVVAAETVKRVALELGGKSANVVLESADLAVAVETGLGAAWQNGGQSCNAWTRMLVPAAKQAEIVEMLVAAAATYVVGDPVDEKTQIGPMSSAAQRDRVAGYLERGIADGAKLVFGGPESLEDLKPGAYVKPSIFTGVAPDSELAQEEVFGPVLAVIPYTSEDEAVEVANSTIYGLAGAVFGEDEHALSVARRLRTGQVDVNGAKFNMLAPFGGYRQSGNGRELGRYGLEEFLETKSIQR
ncbi:aldehyde dehydrogenase family protein [Amycolatopsis pithecellobii]|uniref:Aldehyde dehydrogenase family protein n=1 Tax=Amycolatopsis pithecellobii TaxID=664692 RepID=A0A6N7Z4V3_9PSEU|nr:aldehyde dehydrogenase family protein [Amycolatopsis pithecellobii]MTD55464.1 aldehyde dehydrogenase family protein [Amycolatopsis pithecellobii]